MKKGFFACVLVSASSIILTGSSVIAQPVSCTRQIVKGTNLISLPFDSTLNNIKDVCGVFSKASHKTQIIQINGQLGSKVGWTCDQVSESPTLIGGEVGLVLNEYDSAGTGVLLGDHLPNYTATVPDAGAFPKGTLVYSVPRITCNQNARDICIDAGLTTTTPGPILSRYGPSGAVDATYTCDQTLSAGFPLRLCEGVLISGEVNGPKSFIPDVQPVDCP